MKDRVRDFLRAENKSSAQLAEEIGVQPSSISHIISGRNNPSLDFVVKMLGKYPALSTDWLLFGKGPMYRESAIHSLFSNESESRQTIIPQQDSASSDKPKPALDIDSYLDTDTFDAGKAKKEEVEGKPSRIVLFFDDNTFTEYKTRG